MSEKADEFKRQHYFWNRSTLFALFFGGMFFGSMILLLWMHGVYLGVVVFLWMMLGASLVTFIYYLLQERHRQKRLADTKQVAFWRWWDAWRQFRKLEQEIIRLTELLDPEHFRKHDSKEEP